MEGLNRHLRNISRKGVRVVTVAQRKYREENQGTGHSGL